MSLRLLICALLAAACLSGCRRPPEPPLASHFSVPEFDLIERSGQPLRRADLAGKVWVADFFYSTCPGPCPMLSSRLSEIHKAIGHEPDVRLLSISVDPEKDTPEVLRAYADNFQASDRWLFATGDKAHIYALARQGFKVPLMDAPAEGGLITHSTRLILVDQTGTVRGFYEGVEESSVGALVRDIGRLLQEP